MVLMYLIGDNLSLYSGKILYIVWCIINRFRSYALPSEHDNSVVVAMSPYRMFTTSRCSVILAMDVNGS